MTTHTDLLVGGTTAPTALNHNLTNVAVLKRTIDFANLPAGHATIGSTDTVQFLNVPAGAWVLGVVSKVETAGTATCNYIVGDGADPNGYIDTTNADDLGCATPLGGAFAIQTTGGKFYSSADTIDVTFDTAAPGPLKLTVAALVVLAAL